MFEWVTGVSTYQCSTEHPTSTSKGIKIAELFDMSDWPINLGSEKYHDPLYQTGQIFFDIFTGRESSLRGLNIWKYDIWL